MARNVATFTIDDLTSLGRIDFQDGSDLSGVGIANGDTITQSSSSASGLVLHVVLSNGSWAAGTAEGYLIFQRDNANDFNAAGTDLDNGDTATADPTVVVMDGRLDGRFSAARYYAAFTHTPTTSGLPSDTPARLTGYSLTMLVRNLTTGTVPILGFNLDPMDELGVPVECCPAGRRTEMRHGAWAIFSRWIDDTGTLLIFVVFQGIEGLGAGDSTTIEEFALSLVGGECGDWVDFDLDGITFQLSYETNDTGTPDDPDPYVPSPYLSHGLFHDLLGFINA